MRALTSRWAAPWRGRSSGSGSVVGSQPKDVGGSRQRWNEWIRAHWRIENGSHYVRDTAFAEDASRIRNNPDIAARLRSFAYNLIRAAGGSNIRNARWRAALDLNLILQLPRLH